MTALRIDDLGACSKRYERHAGKWLPYRELEPADLADLAYWLRKTHSRCTLAVTACWVEGDGRLVPYAAKFPAQTEILRQLVDAQMVEIACHGLTHCVPGKHAGGWWWQGNRRWHREFIDAVPFGAQIAQLREARRLLQEMFDCEVTTLVPPGNAIDEQTASVALTLGFDVVTYRVPDSQRDTAPACGITDDRAYTVLHDRDLVRGGVEATLWNLAVTPTDTVRDSVRALVAS